MTVDTVPTPPRDRDPAALRGWLISCFSSWLNLDGQSLQPELPLTHYGIDSVEGVGYADMLQQSLGVAVPTYALWENPSIDALADYLANAHRAQPSAAEVSP